MDPILDAVDDLLSANLVISLLLVVALFAAFLVMRSAYSRFMEKRGNEDVSAPRVRMVRLAYTIVRYVLLFVVIVAILGINGVDVTALAAAAGVAGIIVGFALQDVLSDVAMGLRIVIDNYFSVGQTVRVGETEGVILAITPQSTRIRSTLDDSVITISNRLLTQAKVLGEMVDLDVPLSYELPARQAESILLEAVAKIRQLDDVDDAAFMGTQSFDASSVGYRVRLWSDPAKRYGALRGARRIIQDTLEAHGQSIPYNRLDVHSV